jgi:hypothetical protein
VNRRGDHYFIFQGQTKTGKPKYFASRQSSSDSGKPIEALPNEFEVYESPANGAVSVRRRKPSRILPEEYALVKRLAIELMGDSGTHVELEGDRIIVYTPDTDPALSASALARIFGFAVPGIEEWTTQHTRYTPELRFELTDVDRRIYCAERYCYRGSIDGWIPVAEPRPLERLARKLLPHLGQESFYELV